MLKLPTIIGTGKAIVNTPIRAHNEPTNRPKYVFGTRSAKSHLASPKCEQFLNGMGGWINSYLQTQLYRWWQRPTTGRQESIWTGSPGCPRRALHSTLTRRKLQWPARRKTPIERAPKVFPSWKAKWHVIVRIERDHTKQIIIGHFSLHWKAIGKPSANSTNSNLSGSFERLNENF